MHNHIIKIAISGKMCTGKTTTADALGELFKEAGFIVERVSLAYPLKKVATMLWPDKVKVKDRKMFTDLGAALLGIERGLFGRLLQERVEARTIQWEHYFDSKYDPPKNIVFIVDDLRLEYEAHFMKDQGWYLLRVICPVAIQRGRFACLYRRELTEDIRCHPVETALDMFTKWNWTSTTHGITPERVALAFWNCVRKEEPWLTMIG